MLTLPQPTKVTPLAHVCLTLAEISPSKVAFARTVVFGLYS